MPCPAALKTDGVKRDPLVPAAPGHMEAITCMAGLTAGPPSRSRRRCSATIFRDVAISLGPAEEELISRPYIVRAGYFKDVDAIIYVHIGDGSPPA